MKTPNNDTFGVACVEYLCPICGKPAKHAVIMNSKLTKKAATAVKEMHGKPIDWFDEPCEECQHHINDGAFFIIGIDIEKSKESFNYYRTGHIVGIKKTCDFYKQLEDNFKSKPAMFMDVNDMIALGLIDQI